MSDGIRDAEGKRAGWLESQKRIPELHGEVCPECDGMGVVLPEDFGKLPEGVAVCQCAAKDAEIERLKAALDYAENVLGRVKAWTNEYDFMGVQLVLAINTSLQQARAALNPAKGEK